MIETNKQFPLAEHRKSGRISIVWIIPVVAVLVGGWLLYKTISEQGPTLTITFDNAEGLESGMTRIKYKDVDVGKLKRISLSPDLKKVHVTVSLNKSMSGHINEKTRFWVVRPRISSSGVSGLSTLISGVYIAMDPGHGDDGSIRQFVGLESAPEIEYNAEGRKFELLAQSLGALDRGAPVYFRQIQVGEVTQYVLNDDGSTVSVRVFINAPYHKLVKANSRFWNASGFNLELNSSGISAQLESVAALLTGGIAFETPIRLREDEPTVIPDHFTLYENHNVAMNTPYKSVQHFIMFLDGSLRGLTQGSAVEFKGIKVGEVLNIDLKLDHKTLQVESAVLIALYPENIIPTGTLQDSPEEIVNSWIKRGLHGQLQTASFLTGSLYIDLDFNPKYAIQNIKMVDKTRVIPTAPGALDEMTQNAQKLLNTVTSMPLLEISEELHATISGMNTLVHSINASASVKELKLTMTNLRSLTKKLDLSVTPITKKIEASMNTLDKALNNMGGIVSEESTLYYDLRQLIQDLSTASNSFESLTDYLGRNPNALLYGKSENN